MIVVFVFWYFGRIIFVVMYVFFSSFNVMN